MQGRLEWGLCKLEQKNIVLHTDKKNSLDIVREAHGTIDTPIRSLADESEVLEFSQGPARLGLRCGDHLESRATWCSRMVWELEILESLRLLFMAGVHFSHSSLD